VGFHNGAKDEKLPQVLHEIPEEDKGLELALGSFKSPPPIDIKDVEVSPLHVMIFYLKGVLVGKDYFEINHLLPLPFNLVQGHTLLSKNVISKPNLKEFLMRCLEQFTIYIWTCLPLGKMSTYLRKIGEDMSIDIDPQRIIGQNLCKINKHFLEFPFKRDYNHVDCLTHDKTIYHKNLFDFFHRYPNIQLGNTLLEDSTTYRTYLNPPFNAIHVECYENMPKEDNYLMKGLLLYK
jgi:hypothetical protein